MKKCDVSGKSIFIVENHQEVLPIWAEYYLKNRKSYELITLDYHADSIRAFNDYAYALSVARSDYGFADIDIATEIQEEIIDNLRENLSTEVIEESVKNLDCDEQIMAALELGIISRYQIVYCLCKHNEIGGEHLKARGKYCQDVNSPCIECMQECTPAGIKYCHSRLEDEYLNSTGLILPDTKFILDIDLDYFQTDYSLKPEKFSIFKSLVRSSEFITIARSSEYFNKLRIYDGLKIDHVEVKLIDFINECLSN
jgi:hypothetical protein